MAQAWQTMFSQIFAKSGDPCMSIELCAQSLGVQCWKNKRRTLVVYYREVHTGGPKAGDDQRGRRYRA